MAMVPLSDVVAEAHRALETGDYGIARATCQHVLTHYPSFADMHRLHGEVLLEQGDIDGARASFDRALSFDPQNVLAILGLGVIAEERLDLAGAAAAFQRALEVDPALSQLRDELVRLYSKLYGAGGRLHVSGPGLAAIYARGNQLTLARREFETVTQRSPDRLDLLLALVEVCWRSGDLRSAQALCDRVLDANPTALRALYIRGDIRHRLGQSVAAVDDGRRAAAMDPTGDVARLLAAIAPDQTLHSAASMAPEVPAFEPVAEPLPEPDVPGIAAATFADSEWQRISDELATTGATAAGATATDAPAPPDRARDAAGSMPAPATSLPTAPLAAPVAGAGPAAVGAAVAAAAAGLAVSLATSDADDADLVSASPTAVVAPDVTSTVDLTRDWENTTRELVAATPQSLATTGYTDYLREIDELGVTPFAPDTALLADDPATPDAGTSSEALAAPPMPYLPDAAITAPHDGPEAPPDFATLVESEPDVPQADVTFDDIAWSPPVAEADNPDSVAALQQLVANWDGIDAELAAAIPGHQAIDLSDLEAGLGLHDARPFLIESEPLQLGALAETGSSGAVSTPVLPVVGLTHELRMLDAEGVAPFDFGDFDTETGPLTPPPTSPVARPTAPQDVVLDSAWAELEAQLTAAMPQTTTLPPGFTSELRDLDEAGLQPFKGTGSLAPDVDDDVDPPSPHPVPVADTARLPDERGLPSATVAVLGAAVAASLVQATPSHPAADMPPDELLDDPGAWLAQSATAPLPPPAVPLLQTHAPASHVADQAAPAIVAPPPPAQPSLTTVSPAASGSMLLRPSVFGGTISLSGSVFERLRERKAALVESGAITLRQTAPPVDTHGPAVVTAAEAVVDGDPTDAGARRRLADACAASGLGHDAAMHYRFLLRADPTLVSELAGPIGALAAAYPDEPGAMRLVGELYLRQGRYGQAMEVFRRLLVPAASAA